MPSDLALLVRLDHQVAPVQEASVSGSTSMRILQKELKPHFG